MSKSSPSHNTNHSLTPEGQSKRYFMIGTGSIGAGLIMGFGLTPSTSFAASKNPLTKGQALDTYIHLLPDGTIQVRSRQSEMGQHIGTALAQCLIDEMDADFDQVTIVYPHDASFGSLVMTGGSFSVRRYAMPYRKSGALARHCLLKLAAEKLNTSIDDLQVSKGIITSKTNGLTTSYQALAQTTINTSLTADEIKQIPLKNKTQWLHIGKNLPALDIPDKLTGKTVYASDIQLPNMLVGRLMFPPVRHGGNIISIDDSQAKNIEGYVGYHWIKEGQGHTMQPCVVVLSDSYHTSGLAMKQIKLTTDKGIYKHFDSKKTMDLMKKDNQNESLHWTIESKGNIQQSINEAKQVETLTFENQPLAHAPLENPCAVADWVSNDAVNLYIGTQSQSLVEVDLASTLKEKKLNIIRLPMGGSFGRKLKSREITIPAVLAAAAYKRPVKIMFSREDSIHYGFYRPASVHTITLAINDDKIDGIKHLSTSQANQGEIIGMLGFYDIPNKLAKLATHSDYYNAIPTGSWRAVGIAKNTFAEEVAIDHAASKLNKNPGKLRLDLLTQHSNPQEIQEARKLAHVIQTVMNISGYDPNHGEEGRGFGLACTYAMGKNEATHCAAILDVTVDTETGQITLNKATIVADGRTVINPQGFIANGTGAFLMGLSAALLENITIKDGMIEQNNYYDYRVLSMAMTPEIDFRIIESDDIDSFNPRGIGEPPLTLAAPCLSNAIFNATGARVTQTPMTPEVIKQAIQKSQRTQ